jgi:hypothetical protein
MKRPAWMLPVLDQQCALCGEPCSGEPAWIDGENVVTCDACALVVSYGPELPEDPPCVAGLEDASEDDDGPDWAAALPGECGPVPLRAPRPRAMDWTR